MTNSDIRLQTSWYSNLKRKKLQRRLGGDGVAAFIDLLIYAGVNNPDGDLTPFTDEDIEAAAQWTGPAGEFIATLVDLNFLDGETGLYRIHQWHEHNAYAVGAEARSAQSAYGAACRDADRLNLTGVKKDRFLSDRLSRFDPEITARYLTDDVTHDVTHDVNGCDTLSPSPSPSPTPSPVPNPKTLPDQSGDDTPKPKKKATDKPTAKSLQITDCYQELYLKKFNKKPIWNNVTGKRTRELLRDYEDDADRICRAIENAFESEDKFLAGTVGSFMTLTAAAVIAKADTMDDSEWVVV